MNNAINGVSSTHECTCSTESDPQEDLASMMWTLGNSGQCVDEPLAPPPDVAEKVEPPLFDFDQEGDVILFDQEGDVILF